MKKLILIAFVLFTGLLTSQAQVTVSPGIRGGLNLSNLTNFGNSEIKPDFYLGGLVAIKFNKYFTLQPELTYSRQGAKSEQYEIGGYEFNDKNYDINYFTIGAVGKFHFGGQGFHVLAGPSLDIKTDDNFSYYDDPVGADLSFVGGIGYSLPNGLSFEARFKHGMIDIYGYEDIVDDDYYYDDVILNYAFQFGISYTFKVK